MPWTSRYGVVEDADIVEAGSRLEATFQSVLGSRKDASGEKREGSESSAQSKLDSELMAKLASMDSGKPKALLRLLGD